MYTINGYSPAQRLHALLPALRQAGETARSHRKDKTFEVSHKPDGSPVTSIDIRINTLIKQAVSRHFPGEAFVGEESVDDDFPPDQEVVWYADPIDGTRHYIEGDQPYFILMGCCYRGEPFFGLYYEPESGRILYSGNETEKGPMESRLHHDGQHEPGYPDFTPIPPLLTWADSNKLLVKAAGRIPEYHDSTGRAVELVHTMPNHHNMLAPLAHRVAGFATFRPTAYWDLCGPAAIMRSAGYRVLNVYGEDLTPEFLPGHYMMDACLCLPHDAPSGLMDALSRTAVS